MNNFKDWTLSFIRSALNITSSNLFTMRHHNCRKTREEFLLTMFNLPSSQGNRQSFAHLRILKDFAELESLPSTCEVTQPDLSDLSHLTVTISPDDGYYKGGRFVFSITIPSDYPMVPPKIQCTQTIYHPNINLSGNVCLNILREDWKPILTLTSVILGLIFLFLEPNPEDPLNHEAAGVLKSNVNTFQSNVHKSMSGAMLNDIQYNNVLINK